MFEKIKVNCEFKNVPVNQEFYMERHYGRSGSDSISMTKINDTQAQSIAWPREDIHPDQPCRYYL